MKRTLGNSSLFLAGLLLGWQLAGLAQKLPLPTGELDTPSATPEETQTPGKNINRYGERIVRIG